MASCTNFTCSSCGLKIEAWSDGNRYLMDSLGKRHYFYHPGDYWQTREFYQEQTGRSYVDEEDYRAFWKERGGNEHDLICLHCGLETRRDPIRDSMNCTDCGHSGLLDICRLESQTCPKCKKGTFHGKLGMIS